MIILHSKITKENLLHMETLGEEHVYFDYMVKAVVDTQRELIALNAELHSDLEEYLLEDGSENKNLWGINIDLDTFEIEYDSMINPPRNRETGFPRAGRDVADPEIRVKIAEVVKKWIAI